MQVWLLLLLAECVPLFGRPTQHSNGCGMAWHAAGVEQGAAHHSTAGLERSKRLMHPAMSDTATLRVCGRYVLLEMLAECSVVSSRSWKPAGSCTAQAHTTHSTCLQTEAYSDTAFNTARQYTSFGRHCCCQRHPAWLDCVNVHQSRLLPGHSYLDLNALVVVAPSH